MGRKKAEYIVYNKKTDMPIILGDLQECSSYLGISPHTFKTLVVRTKNNKTMQYDVFNLDELLKDYKDDE